MGNGKPMMTQQQAASKVELKDIKVSTDGALPEVSVADIANGDNDIENPLAVIYGQRHPEIMQHYSEWQYDSESHYGDN